MKGGQYHHRQWCRLIGIFLLIFGLGLFSAGELCAGRPKEAKQVIKDRKGQEVGLYRNSHALVISASKYKHWPGLESVPGETARVAEALKKGGFRVKMVRDPNTFEFQDAFEDFIKRNGLFSAKSLFAIRRI